MPELVFPGRNPDVGFLHCGGPTLSVNISTHTGFGTDVDPAALRRALEELARRAPLLVARIRRFTRRLPGRHHVWVAPPERDRTPIPFEVIDVPPGDEAATARHCVDGANLPIDATREPPLRVELLRRGDGGECHLVTTLHHALYDGASVGFVFYALKRLYVEARRGRPLEQVALPRIVTPRDTELALDQLGGPGWKARARMLRLAAAGWRMVIRESRFRDVAVPGRHTSDGARSLHRTVFFDLDETRLAGLGALLAGHDATLNELLQAAAARAFFAWGRRRALLDRTLPFASTFSLRRPSVEEYALGNFETATCLELQRPDVEDPLRFLDALVGRSRAQQRSLLPLGHYLALSGVVRAPTARLPRMIAKIANRAVLLFSYLGADFTRRYLGHFGTGEEAHEVARLVREHPGTGVGYVTSAPPMGMVITVKRVRRTLAVNLSIHDRLTDPAGLDGFARDLREEVERFAALGARDVPAPAAERAG